MTPKIQPTPAASMAVTSPAFAEGSVIPVRFTCDGADVSPPLAWSGSPVGVKSMALIVDDPDASGGSWVHWVLYGIPSGATGLAEAVRADREVPGVGKNGTSDFRRLGYGGPCPPRGNAHRYFFKLYALGTELALQPGATKKQLLQAMEGHILAQGQLVGTYQRK